MRPEGKAIGRHSLLLLDNSVGRALAKIGGEGDRGDIVYLA